MYNENLHECMLYRVEKANSWACDGRRIINGGCKTNGVKRQVFKEGSSWYCIPCDADYCWECIKEYGGNPDIEVALYPKKKQHLSHTHAFHFVCDNYVKARNSKCEGEHMPDGCLKGEEDSRYFVCPTCQIVLCERCFSRPEKDYIINSETHQHPLKFDIKRELGWRCDIKRESCPKKDFDEADTLKASARCDTCDFDICFNCL